MPRPFPLACNVFRSGLPAAACPILDYPLPPFDYYLVLFPQRFGLEVPRDGSRCGSLGGFSSIVLRVVWGVFFLLLSRDRCGLLPLRSPSERASSFPTLSMLRSAGSSFYETVSLFLSKSPLSPLFLPGRAPPPHFHHLVPHISFFFPREPQNLDSSHRGIGTVLLYFFRSGAVLANITHGLLFASLGVGFWRFKHETFLVRLFSYRSHLFGLPPATRPPPCSRAVRVGAPPSFCAEPPWKNIIEFFLPIFRIFSRGPLPFLNSRSSRSVLSPVLTQL